MRAAAALVAILAAAPAPAQESFDVSAYEQKVLEWKGYAELRPEEQLLRRDSAGYLLQFPGETRRTLERASGAAELSGTLRRGSFGASATGHASTRYDAAQGWEGEARLYEAYAGWHPGSRSGLDVGKRSLRWGKGYAFSPVSFLERPKDPADPELSREGFVMAVAEVVRSFGGPLRALALTAVVLPTTWGVNPDFGPSGDVDVAVKLYGLLLDTDVDLLYGALGEQGQRLGADVSRNLGSNLEVHGEWALAIDAPRVVLREGNGLAAERRSASSYLVGLRYLTERETTVIVEYLHAGGGYGAAELQRFYELVRASATDPALSGLAARAAAQGYGRPSALRDYAYVRISQSEPFDVLYVTPSLTAIVDAAEGSFTLVPEVLYTGFEDLELRLRAAVNRGGASTEFGEKVVSARVELRARYFF